MSYCPNKTLPEYKEMQKVLGDEIATSVWYFNKGNSIDSTPTGSPSVLFEQLVSILGRQEAIKAKSLLYSKRILAKLPWVQYNIEPPFDLAAVHLDLPILKEVRDPDMLLDRDKQIELYGAMRVDDVATDTEIAALAEIIAGIQANEPLNMLTALVRIDSTADQGYYINDELLSKEKAIDKILNDYLKQVVLGNIRLTDSSKLADTAVENAEANPAISEQPFVDLLFGTATKLSSTDILKRFVESKHPLSPLAEKLLEAEKLPVMVELVDAETLDNNNSVGLYRPQSGKRAAHIAIAKRGNFRNGGAATVLHELLHHASVAYLASPDHKDDALRRRFTLYFKHAQQRISPGRLTNALQSEFEFLTNIFTDQATINELKTLKPMGLPKYQNFWEQVKAAILEFFNIKAPDKSLYDEVFELGTMIIKKNSDLQQEYVEDREYADTGSDNIAGFTVKEIKDLPRDPQKIKSENKKRTHTQIKSIPEQAKGFQVPTLPFGYETAANAKTVLVADTIANVQALHKLGYPAVIEQAGIALHPFFMKKKLIGFNLDRSHNSGLSPSYTLNLSEKTATIQSIVSQRLDSKFPELRKEKNKHRNFEEYLKADDSIVLNKDFSVDFLLNRSILLKKKNFVISDYGAKFKKLNERVYFLVKEDFLPTDEIKKLCSR